MRALQIVLFVALCACPGLGSWSGGLRVRFDVSLNLGSDYFIDMPRTMADAKSRRWEQIERPDGPMSSLALYCPGDRIFCVLFDDIEYIAGVQIAIPQDLFQNATFDWETQGFTTWTPATTDGSNATSYWTIQQYFVSEEILATDADERLDAYDTDKPLPYDGVWLTGFNGELTFVSSDVDDIVEEAVFTEQACIFWMGRHYYYQMTENTTCTSETIFPWFPLTASGEVIGMGFLIPGVLDADSLSTDYFERPSQSDIEMIVPDGPECLYELGTSPGVVTMHVYYIASPWLLTCILQ